METLILLIETATERCSCALANEQGIVSYAESNEPNSHSAKLSLLIDGLFNQTQYSYSDLSAIAVSIGPGSYTGLRIGVSTAKGLAYALDIPVIALKTCEIFAAPVFEKNHNACCVAMIDARRMEVYASIFHNKKEIKPCSADILEEGIYEEYLSDKENVIFVGNCLEKAKKVFELKNYFFDLSVELSAKNMQGLAFEKYNKKEFVDVAYFEPFYLKNFEAAPSKVKGLH
ncbi:MAG: tRNA (adenosine(37)-N6)-threonylcarbamoyltransferase complex dimerization subunit type 1 TsaB [Bacteroidales bacterium]|mgnify:CR=1 FL=1|jgi:tRNA threonylcarbamoyladenosine biosynthesis protein TsaB|nr:tRNA (adenosine(37)-N6)-threonylcarbamoyltransferase complex dimerization subunit type 1 TsaB [Bacteroidales bacterium]